MPLLSFSGIIFRSPSAPLAAVLYLIPIPFPFFPPSKRLLAYLTDFLGQV
jgi:hypothetical protein